MKIMEANLVNLENNVIGRVSIAASIFVENPREDIIKRVVDWQRAKARSGDHSVKTVGEVSGSNKKPFKQKGTGNARQGNARGVQRRGGGIAHGPQVRSHAIKLQKKVRKLGLKHALSSRLSSGNIYFVESFDLPNSKTREFEKTLANFGLGKFFIIDEAQVNNNLILASRSCAFVSVVPVIGANVYDIIKSDYILISKKALEALEKRLA